jgi:hypothetical protein
MEQQPLQAPASTSFEILDLMIGPMGGLVTVFVVLYSVYILLKRYIIPMIQGAINRHLEQFEKIIISHDADREVWGTWMASLGNKIDRLSDDVSSMKGFIEGRDGK